MQYGKSQEAIDRLTAEQRRVTQEAGTERPFTGEYNDHTEPGIRPRGPEPPDGNPLPPGNVRARWARRSPVRTRTRFRRDPDG